MVPRGAMRFRTQRCRRPYLSSAATKPSSGSITHAQGTWLHLRLDVIVNPNGDVVLKVFQNDLVAHPLDAPPSWELVPGMVEFIDDHLAINSGSQPLTSGRGGFGASVRDVTRRVYFDHLELLRQV
jgi:hypothetical protein